MITTKLRRGRAPTLAYVTRYPGLTSAAIVGATTDYAQNEVLAALFTLVACGRVRADGERWLVC